MEAAVRFSQNSLPGKPRRFLHVDVTGKSFNLCQITDRRKTTFAYDKICASTKVPAFRAFDWHPVNEDLVAVGQAGGEATLLNIAEGQQDTISFQVRSQRLCNAVALNSQNLLAAGLDKVRTDFCLNIWDFNQRLPAAGSTGFSKSYSDPVHKLASGEPITSLKFFQHEPTLLVAGVKGQFIRLYDLRDSSVNNVLQFATRCVHNLAIDWLDENYFASCYPASDPSICIWDRRMISRSSTPHMSFGGGNQHESRQPEVSLELKGVFDAPDTIWSARYSKAERGCLGVLSSTGNLKVYRTTAEYAEAFQLDHNSGQSESWDTSRPQEIFLDCAQEISSPISSANSRRNDKDKIVSFDFMTSLTKSRQPQLIILNGHGEVGISSTRPPPQPTAVWANGALYRATDCVDSSLLSTDEAAQNSQQRVQPGSPNISRSADEIANPSNVGGRLSSFEEQARHADFGFDKSHVPLSDIMTLSSLQRLRCESGYLLNPSKNKAIVTDSHWLQTLWAWVERAQKLSKNGNMTQDNFDMSFVGIYGLWMEDVDPRQRALGASSNKPSKVIENLVQRLGLPVIDAIATEYMAHRRLCLYITGLAWSEEELDSMVKRLLVKAQHSKAAALAMFAGSRRLAYIALRHKSATQSHKMLAMAIAGAYRKTSNSAVDAPSEIDADLESDWMDTVASLASELTDPYARAILAYVKTGDWSNVVAEDSLPLKYRLCVALRHYDDSKLTRYIAQVTKDVVANGDVEGIILTGTTSRHAFSLMDGYIQRFGDVQTPVLALAPAVPRYLDEKRMVRKFSAWKDAYRSMMSAWNLKFERVRFDIAYQNVAKDQAGKSLLPLAKQQIRLVCQYCAQSITHNAATNEDTAGGVGNSRKSTVKAKAAAVGTVCPKCERHLPRCGVCDMWLGMPDESYLPWYGTQQSSKHHQGSKVSLDLSASVAGSVQTILGPGKVASSPIQKGSPQVRSKSTATDPSRTTIVPSPSQAKSANPLPNITLQQPSALSSGVDLEAQKSEAASTWDNAMSRFTVLCVKCSHGCHAAHARMWFEKHHVCPVPECTCLCNG